MLAPFYAGIQAANAATGRHDLVVGGTVVGPELSYWQQIAAAGGFADLNVVGVHPYTGYDDSYEEDNIPVFLQDLKTLMSDNGAGSDPIFNTEQGWWSDGDGGILRCCRMGGERVHVEQVARHHQLELLHVRGFIHRWRRVVFTHTGRRC